MATPTDPSFGAGFDAAAFRSAIQSTMEMGLPQDTSERVTFRWNVERSFSQADPSGKPYSWTATPMTETAPTDVQIPAAVEFTARPAGTVDTPIGQFDATRVIITVLDTHYPAVQDADLVVIDGDDYQIDFWGPPIGLFDVTLYQCYTTAIDEV